MQGTIWHPKNLKAPLVTGEAQVVEWTKAPPGASRYRVVFTTQGVPDNDLAQHKFETLYLVLDDGRQAKVRVQYVSTLPTGIISTLQVLGDWEDNLVPTAKQAA